METLGGYVKRLRDSRGWTQQELADRAGINRAYLSRIETGDNKVPGADTRRRLASAFGIRHIDILVAAGELAPDEIEPLPLSHIHDHRLQRIVASWPRLQPEVQATMHSWATTAAFLRDEEPEAVAVAR